MNLSQLDLECVLYNILNRIMRNSTKCEDNDAIRETYWNCIHFWFKELKYKLEIVNQRFNHSLGTFILSSELKKYELTGECDYGGLCYSILWIFI